jgi:glyoxylase-like metal-dependent hydrolase (beta-lactamase superfamily II)
LAMIGQLIPLMADLWKMDGGVAFGVVPKSIWNRNNMADENNMIPLVTRCLLIKTTERMILIDTGMGNKRDEKYYQLRHRHPEVNLLKSLNHVGIHPEEITDIIFTHLHDDHVGGATLQGGSDKMNHLFPNATYYCSASQWEWAMNPNKREGASYFPDNLHPLKQSDKLILIQEEMEFFPGIHLKIYNGHTAGQLIPFISFKGKTIIFSGDFIPTAFNVPLAFVPAVDIQPLITMKEKAVFLEEAADQGFVLLFEHDYYNECCTLKKTEKGVAINNCFTLAELINN